MTDQPYLGQSVGPGIPFVRGNGGYLFPRTGFALVWSNIINILGTPLGSVVMQREFGSAIPQQLFEPNDEALVRKVRKLSIEAIERWEPRAIIRDVAITSSNDTLSFLINFSIPGERYRAAGSLTVKREVGFSITKQNLTLV